jgi:hypothetical protein
MLCRTVAPKTNTARDITATDKFGEPFSLRYKSIGVAKAKLMNAQCKNVNFRTFLLFSVFVIGFGHMLDGIIRYQSTAYATGSFGHAAMLYTFTAVTTNIAAAEKIVLAHLTDSFERIGICVACSSFTLWEPSYSHRLQVWPSTLWARYFTSWATLGGVDLGDHHVGLVEIATPLVAHIGALALRRHRGVGQRQLGGGSRSSRALELGELACGPSFPVYQPFLGCIGFTWWQARKLELWAVLSTANGCLPSNTATMSLQSISFERFMWCNCC